MVDGYFEDWSQIQKYQDSDWNEYQEGPEEVLNQNVDLSEYASVRRGPETFFYMSVNADILSGITIPHDEPKHKNSVYTPNSNEIDIISPISDNKATEPVLKGEDTVYIFLDSNGDVPYGFKVNDSFYANQLIEITGQHGLVISSQLYDYSSEEDFSLWSWEYSQDVDSASHGRELEVMATGISDSFKVYYHLMSWDDSNDYSDGFWVVDQFGSRTTPTWSKHSLDSAFNAAWDVQTSDLDNDGDVDVVAVRADGAVQWWENDGSSDPSWTEYTIAGTFGGGDSIYIVDLDNDGDMDVLASAAGTRDDVAWWENDGTPSNGGWDGHT
ncbi:VCBS repeat-containing protein, partial [Marine Group III euryarchaeote]|nr:VCBS repeat-containing protein [Marine Group III euryarchaeote]